jgi:predicted MPP superfamily phosphohydrolase
MEASKIDLYLAGHTHGGQVALPFYGALITLSKTGKKYESGLHHLSNTYMYTNRGIGMEGGKAPRVRFCARPEVTVIDISNSSDSPGQL